MLEKGNHKFLIFLEDLHQLPVIIASARVKVASCDFFRAPPLNQRRQKPNKQRTGMIFPIERSFTVNFEHVKR